MERALIVHPTDLKPVSKGAFRHALKLGLAAQSQLALIHVLDGEGERATEIGAFPPVRETLARWGLLDDGATQGEVSEKLGLYVSKGEISAVDGELGLVKLIQHRNAQMIVLGTRALDGLQRLRESSFSEAISRGARVPTLFVPLGCEGFVDEATGAVSLNNVLVPIAEDPDPTGALGAAVRLARMLGQAPDFHLLHVGQERTVPAVRTDMGAKRHDLVRQGPVVETIAQVAEEVAADVIVMGTAGHKGFLDALRGSTTEGVLRKAHRALLAVPS